MIINISLDTDFHTADFLLEDGEHKIIHNAELYDLVVHDLPKEIAQLVKEARDENAE